MQFMRVSAPLLLPLLRLRAQGEVLARVFLTPGEHSIAEIARATSLSEATVLREVSRLIETGFVTERRQQGRPRLNPATSQFTALLALTVGRLTCCANDWPRCEAWTLCRSHVRQSR